MTLIILFAYAGVVMLFLNTFTSYALFRSVSALSVLLGGFLASIQR